MDPTMAGAGVQLAVRGKYLEFLRASGGWEYVRRTNGCQGVSIVAVTGDGRLLLVEQYRVPLARPVIELPAGIVDPAEDEASAARRELREETGFACDTLTLLCQGPTSPGLADETNAMYLASGLVRADGSGEDVVSDFGCVTHGRTRGIGEEGERIVVHEVPLGTVIPWLAMQQRASKAVDLRIYAALYFAGARL